MMNWFLNKKKSSRCFLPIFLILPFLVFALLISYKFAHAEDSCGNDIRCWQGKIDEYTSQINQLQGQQKTLASAISYLDNKINLTIVQIAKTEQEIISLEEEVKRLSVKIVHLDASLNEISKILNSRIGATYKNSQFQPVYLLFSSGNFSSYLTRIEYLKVAQVHDRTLMVNMEQQKQDYDEQKNLKEKKQKEMEELRKILEGQKLNLAKNKQDKQALLDATKNDEKRYQQMLASARAELEAIQAIIAGKGTESEVGEISKGSRIASIIAGSSPCSSGTHLHFEIVRNGANENPASYLKNISVVWENSPDGQFSFSGSWDWPVDAPVRITQGYGNTYWSRIGWYGGGPHTGLDMDSETSNTVNTVADGTLSRGSIACGGGTLRYVHIKHKDGSMDTYYLHVNYY